MGQSNGKMSQLYSNFELDAKPQLSPSPDATTQQGDDSVVSHKRKLPPPSSRENVKAEFKRRGGWVSAFDNDPDILVSTGEVVPQTTSQESDTRSDGYGALVTHLRSLNQDITQQSCRPKKESITPPKKSRLETKASAIALIEEYELKATSSVATSSETRANETLNDPPKLDETACAISDPQLNSVATLTNSTAFESDDTGEAIDEAYYTQTPSPITSWTSAETEKSRSSDESLCNELAQVHRNVSKQQINHTHTATASHDEDKSWDELRGRKAKRMTDEQAKVKQEEEEERARRSKVQRERNLKDPFGVDALFEDDLEELSEEHPDVARPSSFFGDIVATIGRSQRNPTQAKRSTKDAETVEFESPSKRRKTNRVGDRNGGYGGGDLIQNRAISTTDSFPLRKQSTSDFSSNFGIRRRSLGFNSSRNFQDRQSRRALDFSSLNPSRVEAEKWRTQHRDRESTTYQSITPSQTHREQLLLDAQRGDKKVVTEPEVNGIRHYGFSDAHFPSNEGGVKHTRPTSPDHALDRPVAPLTAKRLARERLAEQFQTFEPQIPLATVGDIDRTDADAIKAEKRRLKEQERDFEALKKAYKAAAIIYRYQHFNDAQNEGLDRLREHAVLILDKGLPGKTTRSGISAIRDSFSRHAAKLINPLQGEIKYEDVRSYIGELLTPARADALDEAIDRMPEAIAEIERLDKEVQQKANAEKKAEKRRVRFASKEPSRPVVKPRSISKKAKEPKKRNLTTAERIKQVEYKLGLYEAINQGTQDGLNTTTADAEVVDDGEDDSSEISEEDADGENYYAVRPQNSSSTFMAQAPSKGLKDDLIIVEEEQDLNEITLLEEQRQQDEAAQATVQTGQAFDERLALENKLADLKRKETAELQGPEEDFDDLVSEASSDASESTDEDDDDEFGPHQAHQYSVRAIFEGIDIFKNSEEYGYGRYLDRQKAETQLCAVISSLKEAFEHQFGRDFDLTSKVREEVVVEQVLKLGDKLKAKVWIEKRVINLSRRQQKRVRKLIPVETGHHWIVDWRKEIETTTITTTTTSATATQPAEPMLSIDRITPIGDDDNDLFGDDEPPSQLPALCTPRPSISTHTTTNTSTQTMLPSPLELDFYTTSHHANMRAKQIYLEWFASFCPKHESPSIRYPEYSGALGQTEKALAQEVDGSADIPGAVVGPWEEEFDREDKTLEEVKEDGEKVETEVRVREKILVRVVRASVKGPRN